MLWKLHQTQQPYYYIVINNILLYIINTSKPQSLKLYISAAYIRGMLITPIWQVKGFEHSAFTVPIVCELQQTYPNIPKHNECHHTHLSGSETNKSAANGNGRNTRPVGQLSVDCVHRYDNRAADNWWKINKNCAKHVLQ